MNIREDSVGRFIDRLAERQATPAGGAVAALCAAQAAALVLMVARYSSKPLDASDSTDSSVVLAVAAECELLGVRSLELAEHDVAAFDTVASAYSLSRDTTEEKSRRSARIQFALVDATDPQAAIAEIGVRLVSLADQLLPSANPTVLVDLAAALEVARGALSIARLNVESNMSRIVDLEVRSMFKSRLVGVNDAIDRAESVSANILRDETGKRD